MKRIAFALLIACCLFLPAIGHASQTDEQPFRVYVNHKAGQLRIRSLTDTIKVAVELRKDSNDPNSVDHIDQTRLGNDRVLTYYGLAGIKSVIVTFKNVDNQLESVQVYNEG